MPLHRRIPKRGFHNLFSKNITALNVRELNRFEEGTEVTPELLQSLGLVGKIQDGVKILGSGELKRKLTVSAHFFSKTATEKIEGAGGSVVKLEK
jgi:large subunit ribosomal protein L15